MNRVWLAVVLGVAVFVGGDRAKLPAQSPTPVVVIAPLVVSQDPAPVVVPVPTVAEPEATFTTDADTYAPGEMIILDAKGSKGTVFEWAIDPPDVFLGVMEGRLQAVSKAPKQPGVIVVVLFAFNDTKHDTFIKRITINGTVPPGPGPGPGPGPIDPQPPAPSTATSATYVYEKDSGAVPPAVMSGLNRLNREKKITATVFEDDSTDGTGDVPDQYKAPLAAAREAGLPALVVMAGGQVLRVVKAPTTEAAVVEAVQ